MIGVPMPPTPDEPTPRQARRADEFRPWTEHGLYLGESDPEVEHMAALRAAVEIARMMRQEAK